MQDQNSLNLISFLPIGSYRTYNFGEKLILPVVLVHISNMKVSLWLDVTSTLLFAISD